MNAPEIRKQLDDWLWFMVNTPPYKPPLNEVDDLKTAWGLLKPDLGPEYWPIIDGRISLLNSYLDPVEITD